jgi:hypothetical protein
MGMKSEFGRTEGINATGQADDCANNIAVMDMTRSFTRSTTRPRGSSLTMTCECLRLSTFTPLYLRWTFDIFPSTHQPHSLGQTTSSRMPSHCHLRLVPFRYCDGSTLHLLDRRENQGAEPPRRGWSGVNVCWEELSSVRCVAPLTHSRQTPTNRCRRISAVTSAACFPASWVLASK